MNKYYSTNRMKGISKKKVR